MFLPNVLHFLNVYICKLLATPDWDCLEHIVYAHLYIYIQEFNIFVENVHFEMLHIPSSLFVDFRDQP